MSTMDIVKLKLFKFPQHLIQFALILLTQCHQTTLALEREIQEEVKINENEGFKENKDTDNFCLGNKDVYQIEAASTVTQPCVCEY